MLTIKHAMFGMQYGDFRPANQLRQILLSRIERLLSTERLSRISTIFAPVVNFTNQTVNIKDDHEFWQPWFARTKTPADGGIVSDPHTAVGFFNADCPAIAWQQDEKLAVMHAGYRCLIRKDSKEPGIIETTIGQFDPKQVKMFMFGGIRQCCWVPEYDDKPEILKPKLSRYPSILKECLAKTQKHGPFGKIHISVDLYKLATRLAVNAGVLQKNITMESRCTCCWQENRQMLYWSHNRFKANKQILDGRNLSLVWLG